jgi:hypothetical protein
VLSSTSDGPLESSGQSQNPGVLIKDLHHMPAQLRVGQLENVRASGQHGARRFDILAKRQKRPFVPLVGFRALRQNDARQKHRTDRNKASIESHLLAHRSIQCREDALFGVLPNL